MAAWRHQSLHESMLFSDHQVTDLNEIFKQNSKIVFQENAFENVGHLGQV